MNEEQGDTLIDYIGVMSDNLTNGTNNLTEQLISILNVTNILLGIIAVTLVTSTIVKIIEIKKSK
ncbi:hypothetical protein [Bacillus sp. B1-b2]|uniref:hypothetical protein n=1 Tax=Bacillus sp. B1-b2 TaxID=2653201 RepID=UPI001261A1B8|nr:hypothetical protein [Bacillus sp. B1-b2]KAB7672096.1 hypothetical protein F9279_04045 [Bacillus sp. B1-b2]